MNTYNHLPCTNLLQHPLYAILPCADAQPYFCDICASVPVHQTISPPPIWGLLVSRGHALPGKNRIQVAVLAGNRNLA